MTMNNKILTVSYGTFSCTLEGFEDSLETMMAIAEYFRDLAADDRYFGSEPPQPDGELLARIAEKEASRQVAVQQRDDGFHLSAEPVAALPAAAAIAMSQTETVQNDPSTAQVDGQVDNGALAPDHGNTDNQAASSPTDTPDSDGGEEDELPAIEDPAPSDTANAYESSGEEIEQVAEEDPTQDAQFTPNDPGAQEDHAPAQSIEGPLTLENPVLAPEPETEAAVAQSDVSPSDDAEAHEEEPAQDQHASSIEDVEDIETPEDVEQSISAFMQSADVTTPSEEPDTETTEADIVPSSIADKLQRIRNVVSKKNEAREAEYSEDQHSLADDISAEDFETDVAFENTHPEAEDELDANPLGELEELAAELAQSEVPQADEPQIDETPTTEIEDALSEDDEDDVMSLLQSFENTDADDPNEPRAEQEPAVTATKPQTPIPTAPNPSQQEPAARQTEAAPAPRARVIKVKRADLEAALDNGILETVKTPAHDDTANIEDEADLMLELAALENDFADEAPNSGDRRPQNPQDESAKLKQDAADVMEQAASEARGSSTFADESTDLDRLMAAADEKMGEPEGSSRRNAFDHLRAAVAASQEDDALRNTEDTPREEAYRSDLAEAVRPRRPSQNDPSGDVSKRAASDRPEPLALVAENRVEPSDISEVTGTVRPRRIASPNPGGHGAASTATFAQYAAENGAIELGDLLEAAASYLSFVEGRDQFSRPQLMTKVRQVEKDDFSREDGLRCFGQLLRTGKIEKIKGGRFTVSEGIGFKPESKAVMS